MYSLSLSLSLSGPSLFPPSLDIIFLSAKKELQQQYISNMFLEQNIASPAFLHPSFILQMQSLHEEDPPHNHQEHHHSLLPCSINPQDFSRGIHASKRVAVSFSGNVESCEEELSDDCSQPGEKKRRLNMEQVRTLEKSFELGNKLEPERKIQLARALGLRPRQIAIWFQNRRARWKTKQLEKDYGLLRRQFEAAKSENDALQLQNKKLQAEILALKGMEAPELINLNKETEGSCSNRSENSCEINLDISRTPGNQSIPFFPSNSQLMSSQILQSSSTPINDHHAVPEENFNSFLCGMEDQAAFWPWPDHQNRH